MNEKEIARRFNYHKPDENKALRHQRVRENCRLTALCINDDCGEDSREKSLAMTHLEEAMYWANAAIAREGK
jgi:hypothetical protein